MKNYLKPTLLALFISTACAFAKDEGDWKDCAHPFNSPYMGRVKHITTSQDGRLIFVVLERDVTLLGDLVRQTASLYKSTDGGVTWFYLSSKK